MSDGNKLLSNVSSKFGAPMGRRNILDNPSSKVRLFRVRMVDGAYDRGGAYWGIGHNPLYAAIGEGFQAFLRSPNRQDAKHELLGQYQKLRFYR